MDIKIDTNGVDKTSNDNEKETVKEAIIGYGSYFTVFGLAGVAFRFVTRQLTRSQKDRIFEGVMDKVLPVNKKK